MRQKPSCATPQDGPFGEVPNWAALAWRRARDVCLEGHDCAVNIDRYSNPAYEFIGDGQEKNNYQARSYEVVRMRMRFA